MRNLIATLALSLCGVAAAQNAAPDPHCGVAAAQNAAPAPAPTPVVSNISVEEGLTFWGRRMQIQLSN